MTTYTIDTDNNIQAFATPEQAPEGLDRFASEEELATLASGWPAARLVEIWNSFAGVVPFDDLKPVKKFTDRATAVSRIWRALERLTPAPAPPVAPAAPAKAKTAPKATTKDGAPTARLGSKKAIVLALLRRPEGATLPEMMYATGWQKHSVRGFLSGAIGKKMGLALESAKREDGLRVYRVTG